MLSEQVQAAVFGYLATVDEQLPHIVTGLYVVGSVALGDFQERSSNLDMVVVSDSPWSSERLALARRAQRGLDRHRPACVAYVMPDELLQDPRSLDCPCFEGSSPVASERLVNPLTWNILASGAMDLRGPDQPVLWDDPHARREWAADRLRTTWLPAARRCRRLGSLWLRQEVSTTVLEVARLATTARSGAVLSKVEASRVVRHQLPDHFRRILADSAGYRLGGRSSMYWGPVERKKDALELMGELVAIAADGAPHAA